MLSSQLLLTGFVIQWLFSQYKDEKSLLVKELKGFYINSHDQVLDTMLFKTYIDPVLTENRIIMVDHRMKGQDSARKKIYRFSKLHGEQIGDSDMITVNIKDDTLGKTTVTANRKVIQSDMLLKSVKMIIAHTGDTLNMKNQAIIDFSTMDTSKFKKFFCDKISSNGMKFRIKWDNTQLKPGKVIIIEPLPGFSLPNAAVSGYEGYLFSQITTQIIFGVILVFITAIAFFVAYRSIRNQMILNSLRNEFVSNITHELKTPVSTIMVALEALGNYDMKKEPKVMEEYLRLASMETKRLGELINRVLDHTLLEQKEHPLVLCDIDLNSMLTEVVVIMQWKIGNKGRIEYNEGENNLVISGDPLYIKGVLINLLDNSIKYADKEPVISVSAGRKDESILIEINDNGPGIPPQYQRKIFEKFFRLPTNDVHNVKGYGLGLSFAYLVMQLHKGSIEVKNHNPGCSFILKFPVK